MKLVLLFIILILVLSFLIRSCWWWQCINFRHNIQMKNISLRLAVPCSIYKNISPWISFLIIARSTAVPESVQVLPTEVFVLHKSSWWFQSFANYVFEIPVCDGKISLEKFIILNLMLHHEEKFQTNWKWFHDWSALLNENR